MSPDGAKPAFSRAIPHVVVGITLLLKVVIFGSFWESRNGLIWGPEMVPFGSRNGAIWGPEMIPFGNSKLIYLGTDLVTENRD